MGDALNVRVGADGGVSGAPLATAVPTAVEDELDVAFDDYGYISDDGMTETIGRTTSDIKNWKGDVVRVVQTEHRVTYQLTFIETTDLTEEAFYGSDPSEGIKAVAGLRQAWVFDVFDGDDTIRVVVPDGQVKDTGDVTYKNDQAVAYQVTIEAYPDGDGNKAFKYRSVSGS